MSWGFASMVEEYSGVALDKSESRTDWLARPLTERQCEYAAADVWYLLPIASQLMAETDRAGWLPAALDECRVMQQRRQVRWSTRPRPGAISATPGSCVPASWVVCSCWRSGACAKRAQRDLAVNFVVREEHLWSVARYMPTSLGELDSLGLSGSEIRFHGKTLISLVEKAQALPESALPAPLQNLDRHAGLPQSL